MAPRFLFAAALVLAAPAAAEISAPEPGPLFEENFRALLGPGGAILVDKEMYDVGPQRGETAFWNAQRLALIDAPADALLRKKEGRRLP